MRFSVKRCEIFNFCILGGVNLPFMIQCPTNPPIKAMFAEIDRMDRGVRGAKPVREVRVQGVLLGSKRAYPAGCN